MVPVLRVPICDYTGTQVMVKLEPKAGIFHQNFAEYRNFPTKGWGEINKHHYEWYSDTENSVSVIKYHEKTNYTNIYFISW